MNNKTKVEFLTDLKELLDKYNVDLITCGCCGGVGVYQKGTGQECISFVDSGELEEILQKCNK